MAYARPLTAKVAEAVWRAEGTLMAQWLFWQTRTLGVLKTAAKFMAAWKSGSLVAPSPTKPTTTVRSRRSLAAQAAPTAWGSCGPRQLDQETWFTLRPLMCEGICRPLRTSPELPKTWATYLVS